MGAPLSFLNIVPQKEDISQFINAMENENRGSIHSPRWKGKDFVGAFGTLPRLVYLLHTHTHRFLASLFWVLPHKQLLPTPHHTEEFPLLRWHAETMEVGHPVNQGRNIWLLCKQREKKN